jgi:hypothetical protein
MIGKPHRFSSWGSTALTVRIIALSVFARRFPRRCASDVADISLAPSLTPELRAGQQSDAGADVFSFAITNHERAEGIRRAVSFGACGDSSGWHPPEIP